MTREELRDKLRSLATAEPDRVEVLVSDVESYIDTIENNFIEADAERTQLRESVASLRKKYLDRFFDGKDEVVSDMVEDITTDPVYVNEITEPDKVKVIEDYFE